MDQTPAPTRYHGFSLKSVCWGYREIFREAIESLFREGLIGPNRRQVTAAVFDLLRRADQSHFDHVLKEFLGALSPRTRWLVELPGLFADVVELGGQLGRAKLHHGIGFFEALGRGGLGDTPGQVRDLLTHVRRLRQTDDELAMAFMKGYRRLVQRLAPDELARYIRAGLEVFERNRRSGLAFMEGTLKTSEVYIRSITRECRLEDVHGALTRLLRALVGRDVEVGDLGRLDSDDLYERGSSVVCLYKWLYLPARIRDFDGAAQNRDWYLLTAVAAAALLAEDSFPRVHGHPEYPTCRGLVGDEALRLNLFQIVEHVRALRRAARRWPGARRLIDFGLETEFARRPPATPADGLFFDAARRGLGRPAPGDGTGAADRALEALIRVADASVNCFDTARRLDEPWAAEARTAYPGLDACSLRPAGFLPDFLFPGSVSAPPRDALVADLKRAAEGAKRADDAGKASARRAAGQDDEPEGEEEGAEEAVAARYVYDEWSQEENDYRRDYCFLRESVPEPRGDAAIPSDIADEARRVSRVFQRFKPDLARREKYLRDGDVINPDLLLEYLVQRRREPSPRLRFYERPRINRRDLAVLVLLDSSGSTHEPAGPRDKIIDVEKHAALILGQGLASLGDRFAICGFHSSGREQCTYFVYKEFDQPWDRASIARVLSASPANSTRIGPALRHSGYRLARADARQRLVILITDGRPMDSGYDPNTRYAQYDVRMACEENLRQGVHTFAISTDENSLPDMELMFPGRRFAILSDIRQLLRVLPRAYIRITT